MAKQRRAAEIIRDRFIEHNVDLMRVKESVREKVLVNLMQLDQDLQEQMQRADVAGTSRTDYQLRRAENLIAQTKDTIGTAYKRSASVLQSQLIELADLQSIAIPKLVNSVFKSELMSTSMTRNDLVVIARDSLIEGAPSKDWWAKQNSDTRNRFATQIRMGVMSGETNDQIANRILGRRIGTRVITIDGEKEIVPLWEGGVMDVTKQQATALVRSSVQTISNEVLAETYSQNEDVLDGTQAVATLDLRTTAICRARDGGAWDHEGNPLPGSPVQIPFPGNPPWHWQCRTIMIPVVKSWDDLAGMKGIKEISSSTRSSMDGQISDKITYEEWLRNQNEDRQKQVLGAAKWELWKGGNLTMAEMVDQQGNPLTVEQLKAKLN